MKIIERTIPESTVQTLVQSGINPLLARLYVARGVQSCEELDTGLGKLLPPSGLKGIQEAARVLANAIARQQRICIVADYDCDGATACAVGIRGLRMLGAQHVSYEVPDRITDGYGLSAPIARRVHAQGHELLLTVDMPPPSDPRAKTLPQPTVSPRGGAAEGRGASAASAAPSVSTPRV
jgi:single-stranded-DNA-specific exonuclease